jgi:2-C-methyl-D-erythritol 4-phosphate cytidylyltransferase
LERFEACPTINEIILVLPAEAIENFSSIAANYKLKKLRKTVAGGKTRNESVFSGLSAINFQADDIVAVHDGARPLVSAEEITKTVEKAGITGAACLVASVTDTIKEVAAGKIIGTVDRVNLRRALTPQCFRYEILQRAFAENKSNVIATDECLLVEKSGYEIAVVEGSARNIKITTPEDFVLAAGFLKELQNENV